MSIDRPIALHGFRHALQRLRLDRPRVAAWPVAAVACAILAAAGALSPAHAAPPLVSLPDDGSTPASGRLIRQCAAAPGC